MSLLGLLAMGRTFGTVRRRPPSYHLAEGWLPEFGRRQERMLGDLGGHEAVLAASSWPERDVGGIEASPLFEARSGLAMEPTPFRLSRPDGAAEVAARPAKTAEPTGPSGGGRLVQSELSLDAVRVLRNDLLADDLELVPRVAVPVPAVHPRGASGRRTVPAASGWRGWLTHWWCFLRRRTS